MTQIICGVDVGSETLDARIGQDGAWQRFAREAEGIAALAAFCKTYGVDLVVMEATGGYERLPFAQLWGAGQPTALVNPRAVRQFAQAMGRLEKTDRIDCGMIAWYAEVRRIKPVQPASAGQQRLSALVVRLHEAGAFAPSTTRVGGRLAIRAAIVNHRTAEQDVDGLVGAVLNQAGLG